jgi:hypothetical protein
MVQHHRMVELEMELVSGYTGVRYWGGRYHLDVNGKLGLKGKHVTYTGGYSTRHAYYTVYLLCK